MCRNPRCCQNERDSGAATADGVQMELDAAAIHDMKNMGRVRLAFLVDEGMGRPKRPKPKLCMWLLVPVSHERIPSARKATLVPHSCALDAGDGGMLDRLHATCTTLREHQAARARTDTKKTADMHEYETEKQTKNKQTNTKNHTPYVHRILASKMASNPPTAIACAQPSAGDYRFFLRLPGLFPSPAPFFIPEASRACAAPPRGCGGASHWMNSSAKSPSSSVTRP